MSSTDSDIIKNIDIWEKRFKYIKNSFVYEPVLDLIISIIEKHNYKRILDYGCGNGRFGYFLASRKGDKILIGIDISGEALKLCSNFYNKLYLTDGLSVPDEEFDFILLNSVLEHIPFSCWDIFLKNLKNRLDKGGAIFIIFPNKNSPMRRLTKRWQGEEENLGHVSLVNLKILINKLREAGFNYFRFSFLFKIKRLPDYFLKFRILNGIFILPYYLLNICPFYYLRDSFWILAK